MRLYVEELKATPLVQTFTRATACQVAFFRLHLVKYLSPAGTFILQLTDSSDNVIATSSQTLADMQTEGSADLQENYYHGQIKFTFDRAYNLRANEVYKIKLSSSGYTYSDTDFIGWCKAFEDPAIPVTGDVAHAPIDSPYDFETYVYQRLR